MFFCLFFGERVEFFFGLFDYFGLLGVVDFVKLISDNAIYCFGDQMIDRCLVEYFDVFEVFVV